MTHERDSNENDQNLEAYFAAARAETPTPSDALMARVMADADAALDARNAAATQAVDARARGGLMGVFRSMGGWPAMAGLSCATLAGLWIGVAPPEVLAVTAQGVWGVDTSLNWDAGDGLFLGEEAL